MVPYVTCSGPHPNRDTGDMGEASDLGHGEGQGVPFLRALASAHGASEPRGHMRSRPTLSKHGAVAETLWLGLCSLPRTSPSTGASRGRPRSLGAH